MIHLFIILSGLLAAMLQSCIGFGAAIVMVNVLSILLPPSQVVAMSQFACILLSTYIVIKKGEHIRWKVILPMSVPTLACCLACTVFAGGLDTGMMKLVFGIVFILLALYFSLVADKVKIKPTLGVGMAMGVLSGSLNGLVGIGGPPAVLYLAPSLEDKDEYMASSQMFFLLSNLLSLLTKVFMGKVSTADMVPIAVCGGGALVGSMIGLKLTGKIKGTLLKRLVYVIVGINGIIITLKCLI